MPTLAAVRKNLSPGGLFVFDMNTRVNYDTFWQGKDVYEGPNYRLTTQTRFTPETGRAQVEYLAEEHTENGLVALEETVTEQYFDEMLVEELLKAYVAELLRGEPVAMVLAASRAEAPGP